MDPLILAIGIILVAPVLIFFAGRRLHRRYRFSLRTLFVVVTLFAVVLGAGVAVYRYNNSLSPSSVNQK